MEIVAQWVRIRWTKQSRGGSAAVLRNALPVAFPLPEVAPLLTHEVILREWDDFEPQSSLQYAPPDQHDVSLRLDSNRVRVNLLARPFGRPHRRRRPPAVRLTAGDRLRWQINYRDSGLSGGKWIYSLDTLNLACGRSDPDVFLRPPTHHVQELVSLF